MAQLKRERRPYDIPELEAGDYIIAALFEAGPTIPNPMGGELPLDWATVWAYSQATEKISEPWEFTVLINASQAYAEWRQIGKDFLAIPPGERDSEE